MNIFVLERSVRGTTIAFLSTAPSNRTETRRSLRTFLCRLNDQSLGWTTLRFNNTTLSTSSLTAASPRVHKERGQRFVSNSFKMFGLDTTAYLLRFCGKTRFCLRTLSTTVTGMFGKFVITGTRRCSTQLCLESFNLLLEGSSLREAPSEGCWPSRWCSIHRSLDGCRPLALHRR
jgi:hypothetical protein